jgi:hypothetical protein
MAIIQTKYSVGDTVYAFGCDYVGVSIQCQDCLGTLKWKITFANGRSEDAECQTCKRGYDGACGKIYYNEWLPVVETITIKEVRFGSEGAEYLSEYFSINDGKTFRANRVHKEAQLFIDKDEAEIAAQAEYEKRMAYLADNNFPKKGDFAKALERSTLGYCRSSAIIHTEKMRQWINLIRPLKSKGGKHQRQFEGDYKEKKINKVDP